MLHIRTISSISNCTFGSSMDLSSCYYKSIYLNTLLAQEKKKTVRSQLKMLVALATLPDLLLAVEVRTCEMIIKAIPYVFLTINATVRAPCLSTF